MFGGARTSPSVVVPPACPSLSPVTCLPFAQLCCLLPPLSCGTELERDAASMREVADEVAALAEGQAAIAQAVAKSQRECWGRDDECRTTSAEQRWTGWSLLAAIQWSGQGLQAC